MAAAGREARRVAGLSFWRLVWIVALGILIAEAVSGALAGLFSAATSGR